MYFRAAIVALSLTMTVAVTPAGIGSASVPQFHTPAVPCVGVVRRVSVLDALRLAFSVPLISSPPTTSPPTV